MSEIKKIVVDYTVIRDIFDRFGGVFFGYVRAMNIAHQGWLYLEGDVVAEQKNEENEMGCVTPVSIKEYKNGGARVVYRSRSGNEYIVDHSGENAYYDIEFSYPADSCLADEIDEIYKKWISAVAANM